MKKLVFTAVLLISCLSFKLADAQIHLSVGVNIGAQPDWGPVGYDHADYYYMPDIGVYYDVPVHQYVYLNNGVWVHQAYLPVRYRDYDIYHGYKVVVNRPEPWRYDGDYRSRYAGYRGRRDQVIIRDSHDDRYRNHWHDNGRHEGWDKHDRGGDKHDRGGDDQGRGEGHGHGHGHD
ncbi:MAG TPA: hypothetical protein VK671_01915 [Mucilaginibacter sp.]|nr:hypothetical protein [Mucilaginibacter sp.]